MTDKGGKFGGLMEEQSKTITGQISNIEDAISTMFNKIGKENESIINSGLSGVSYLVEHWEAVVTAIESAAVAYGTYKAAVMTAAALHGVEQTLKVDTEIDGLKTLLEVKKQSNNADIAAAVASGKLTESKAAELTMLREELALKISSLETEKGLAEKAYANALLNFNTAEKDCRQRRMPLTEWMIGLHVQKIWGIQSLPIHTAQSLQKRASNFNLPLLPVILHKSIE